MRTSVGLPSRESTSRSPSSLLSPRGRAQRQCVLEVALDTNAFSTIFDAKRDLARRAAAWVKCNRVRFILPNRMLEETLSGGVPAVIGRLKSLRTFYECLPNRSLHLGLAADVPKLLLLEQRGHRSASTPVQTDARSERLFAAAQNAEYWNEDVRAEMRARTQPDLWTDTWKAAQARATPQTRRALAASMDNMVQGLRSTFSPEIVFGDEYLTAAGVAFTDNARRICADPWGHRAIALHWGLFWLLKVGGALHGAAVPTHKELALTDANDAADIDVAVAAAYCPAFVTGDAGLSHRLSVLRTAGLAFVFTVTTEMLVALIEAEAP